MKKLVLGFLLAVVILGIWFFWRNGEGGVIERNESFDVSKVIFLGEDGKEIHALFFSPKKEEFDVVIVLPAAGGTKESRRMYAEILQSMGYGSLILDQRGLGETGGYVPGLEEEFQAFAGKKDVFQLMMAKDVVSAVDFLNQVKKVRHVAVLGESMGGRNALIGAALDKRIKGAVIISSAGYQGSTGNAEADAFISYINPNTYVSQIAPRRILMLHAINDSVIRIDDARFTLALAGEPKKLQVFSELECNHGYCEPMRVFIEEELKFIFR